MTYQNIDYTVADRVATITLDRPDQLNTITPPMLDEIVTALDAADTDPEVRAIIVTGRGKAFCAGADVSGGTQTFDAAEAGWGDDPEEFRDGGGRIALRIFQSTTPVIGVVNGVAAGLGATMLLPMDIVLAADSARIGFVFSRRGIVPEACATWFLPRRVGISTALEWCFTGRLVPAAEAHEAGLLHSVHPAADVLGAGDALARQIADNAAPVAVGMIRQMLWHFSGSAHPMDAHRVDSQMNYALGQSQDVKEGLGAFLDKRAPDFPGRLPQDAPPAFPWWQEPPFRIG